MVKTTKYGIQVKENSLSRCEKSSLFLPFLLHGLMDILLTLAAGRVLPFMWKQMNDKINNFETGGTLAAGLFLSGGLVTRAFL